MQIACLASKTCVSKTISFRVEFLLLFYECVLAVSHGEKVH